MGIRTLTLGKKLHITFKLLPKVFNVTLGNFPCLVLRRFVWVKINENKFTDYTIFYDN